MATATAAQAVVIRPKQRPQVTTNAVTRQRGEAFETSAFEVAAALLNPGISVGWHSSPQCDPRGLAFEREHNDPLSRFVGTINERKNQYRELCHCRVARVDERQLQRDGRKCFGELQRRGCFWRSPVPADNRRCVRVSSSGQECRLEEATIVILSDKPIDAVALTATSTYRDMAAQDAFKKSNAGYVILKFDGAQLVSVTAAGAGGESSGIGGGLKASIKTNDGHRIEGHCCEVSKTLKNVTADFEFALPVVAAVAGS